ncbi:TIR domain-containing protein [Streptomyces shenzhenensis]|uniref:TIR domain-containing protein n=1 Tax=Streptomyces shenzhenensis TaxID=943815 RepID=UPI0015EFE636|nr:nucleotide-binding protein [Streptomyces shenzhenensis]
MAKLANPLPSLFIGSSSEQIAVAENMQALLDSHFDVFLWTQGVFRLTKSNLDSLIEIAKTSDFAVLICDADDVTEKRGEQVPATRDNVLFELGLFIGTLGPERTFIVHNQSNPPNIPSDLLGISRATYRERANGDLRSALGTACLDIREAARRVGLREPREALLARSAVRSLLTMANSTREVRRLAETAREARERNEVRNLVGQLSIHLSALEEGCVLAIENWRDAYPKAMQTLTSEDLNE